MLDLIVGAVLAGIAILGDDDNKQPKVQPVNNINTNAASEEARLKLQQQMFEKNALARTTMLNELYAKLAICCYIAWADGRVSPAEKRQLDAVYLEIYNSFPNDLNVRNTLQSIYCTPNFGFIHLEKYLRSTTPETIASFLEVADEMAQSDGYSSEKERLCIYKIRKYLTDRTGINYTGISTNEEAKMDLRCPGCYATMELQPHNRIAVCPFCGNTKPLSSGAAPCKPASNNTPAKKKAADPSRITFRCPICNTLLSASKTTERCACAKCKTNMMIRNGQPAIW